MQRDLIWGHDWAREHDKTKKRLEYPSVWNQTMTGVFKTNFSTTFATPSFIFVSVT
jgi:hypothetical protein